MKKGFSLTGIILSILMISVMAIVGFDVHVLLSRSIVDQQSRFRAINYANSQLEDLKEKAKSTLLSDDIYSQAFNKSHTLDADDLEPDYTLVYDVTDANWIAGDPAEYKVITATATYPLLSGDSGQLQLTGFVVE